MGSVLAALVVAPFWVIEQGDAHPSLTIKMAHLPSFLQLAAIAVVFAGVAGRDEDSDGWTTIFHDTR